MVSYHPEDGVDMFSETSDLTGATRCNTAEDIRYYELCSVNAPDSRIMLGVWYAWKWVYHNTAQSCFTPCDACLKADGCGSRLDRMFRLTRSEVVFMSPPHVR
jgi:hypothetical protein